MTYKGEFLAVRRNRGPEVHHVFNAVSQCSPQNGHHRYVVSICVLTLKINRFTVSCKGNPIERGFGRREQRNSTLGGYLPHPETRTRLQRGESNKSAVRRDC